MWKKHTHSAHRLACLTLYRALLTHTVHLPLPVEIKNAAAFHIRQKFRKSLFLQGRNLQAALILGYENEGIMRRACQNHMPSISTVRDRVSSIISEQARLVERSRLDPRPILEPPSSPPTPPTRKSKLKKLAMPPEERRKLLAEKRLRPPVMKCTNGLPLLYFPGMKQSRKVTQAVNGQIKARTRKVDVVKYMEADGIQMAKLEDEWDRNLQRYAGFIGDRGSDSTWEASAHDALRILQAAYNEEKRKNITEINKLQGIIDSRNYQYGKLRQKRLGERRRRYRQRRRLAH